MNSYYYNESFADIHKVAGLRGIYIASQLISANGSFSVENQRSLITFDKGGEWNLLNPPTDLHGRPNRNCTKVCHWTSLQYLKDTVFLGHLFCVIVYTVRPVYNQEADQKWSSSTGGHYRRVGYIYRIKDSLGSVVVVVMER